MAIKIHKLPDVLETYFLDEAKGIPAAYWGCASSGGGFLGSWMRRLMGQGVMAGWALTVECPPSDSLATYVALQHMLEAASQGRWVMVIAPPDGVEPKTGAQWGYIQSAMAWEVGFVGAVVAGYARDIEELRQKLGKEFSVFAYGGSPIPSSRTPEGEIGAPVRIGGCVIRTGDLIVGDDDGVIVVAKADVEKVAESCRMGIVEDANSMQHVREGRGAVEVMGLRETLEGKVEVT